MSSRRDLKKLINNSMSSLYADCVLYTVISKEPKLDKLERVLSQLNKVNNDLLSRVSISEGKEIKARTKVYYKKIKDDLKQEVNSIGKQIQELD